LYCRHGGNEVTPAAWSQGHRNTV